MASMHKGKKKWLIRGLEIALLVVVIAGVQAWRSQGTASGMAPALTAALVDGGQFDLSTAQRPILVHFWGSWCPICRLGQGSIDSLAKDGRVITVALGSGSDAEIKRHLREEGVSFPVINDESGSLADRWGVQGVPANFIVDPKGEIRFRSFGYTTAVGLRARLWLADPG